jgi:hypothetical protein
MSSEFGIYRLSYTPTTWHDTAYVESTIDMSISGEADLRQMLSFFESFLRASGYNLDGKELTLERTAPDFDAPEPSQQWAGYSVQSFGKGAVSIGNATPQGK